MSRRARILAFGTCAVLVVAGALCAVLLEGGVRDALSFALLTFGLGGALLLVFAEVGFSEDRARAREAERRRRPQLPRWPRRPG